MFQPTPQLPRVSVRPVLVLLVLQSTSGPKRKVYDNPLIDGDVNEEAVQAELFWFSGFDAQFLCALAGGCSLG